MVATMLHSVAVGNILPARVATYCVDTDADKVASLRDGKVPIYEPGLDDLLARNLDVGRIEFSTDVEDAVANAELVFLAVGTPMRRGDGYADLSYVHDAVARLARIYRRLGEGERAEGYERRWIEAFEARNAQAQFIAWLSLGLGRLRRRRIRRTRRGQGHGHTCTRRLRDDGEGNAEQDEQQTP